MNIRDELFFEECDKRVIAMTESAFEKKSVNLCEDKKTKAFLRMKRELEIIINNGFSCEYYLLKVIVEHSLTKKQLVTIGGQISYSYVAYLLGISTIDPLERDYEIEMLLDYHHDRNPYMLIIGSGDNKKTLVDYLCDIFGEEQVRADDLSITIGEQLDNNDCLRIGYQENELIEITERIIKSNNIIFHNKFEKARDSVFSPHYSTGMIPSDIFMNVLKILKRIINSEIKSESEKRHIHSLFDATYEGLLHALAVIHGTGIAEADLQDSEHNKILTRDDLYKLGLSLFGTEKEAYDFMTNIRKGRGKDHRYQEHLKKQGVPYDVLEKLKIIQYVVSEGSLITEAQIILFLASKLAQE